ncbi:hypothetical protein ES707_19738 [subsurface metagenome]
MNIELDELEKGIKWSKGLQEKFETLSEYDKGYLSGATGAFYSLIHTLQAQDPSGIKILESELPQSGTLVSLALVKTRKDLEIWVMLPHEAVSLKKSFEEKKHIPGLIILDEQDKTIGDS